MKLKYIFVLAACMATLAACTREGTMPTEGVPHGEGLAVKLLHSHYEGNPSSKGTYGETGAFDRVEIMVADEEGNRTGDIKYMYDKSSSTVHVEGLVPGSYQLLTLGIKGDWQKDSVTIYSIASTSQTWLAFPEDLDRPLEAEYFYSKTPFRVSVQDGKATADMPSSISLQRMTGRADFRFRYRNPYVETAVQSATVTMRAPKFMTELSGDGQFSGESLGNDIILGTHERQEFLFPPAVRQETLYGEAEVVCRTYRGGNSRNVYSFTLEPVRENRISTVEVDASNPEDGTGTMFITAAAYEKGRYKAILQDTDPGYRVLNLTVSPYNDATTSYFHRSVGGYHGAKLARYQDLIDRYLAYNNQQVLDMLNTRYVIVPGADGQPQAQRRTTAFGAAWFVDSLAPARSAQEEIDLLGEVNLRTTAVVNTSQTEESMQRPMPSGIYDSARIDLAEYRPNYLRYEYSTPEEAIAVFSEIYYDKGWKAFIDGAEAPYFRADYVLRAMRLPAGEHVVEWRFRAPGWNTVEAVRRRLHGRGFTGIRRPDGTVADLDEGYLRLTRSA